MLGFWVEGFRARASGVWDISITRISLPYVGPHSKGVFSGISIF